MCRVNVEEKMRLGKLLRAFPQEIVDPVVSSRHKQVHNPLSCLFMPVLHPVIEGYSNKTFILTF
jgi:hypothetical protein